MPAVAGFRLRSGQKLIRPPSVQLLLHLPLSMLPLSLSSFLTAKLLLQLDLSAKVSLICCTDLPLTAGSDTNDEFRVPRDEFKGQNR